MSTSPAPCSPKPVRVRPAIQFSWSMLISRVSSRLTTFFSGGMNCTTALRVVVLPEAVPPAYMRENPFSTRNQK